MKKYFFILILSLFTNGLKAQWYSQSINATGYFGVVYFANDSVGWMSSNNPSKIYKTTDGGENWFLQHEPDGPIISIFFLDENNGWFTDMDSNGGRLVYTSNGGNNWVQHYPANGLWFHSLYFFDVNNGIAGGSARPSPGFPQVGAIFKTTDGGFGWDMLYTGVISNALYFLNDLTGWCGGFGDSTNMFKTIDGGLNWMSLPANLEGGVLKINFLNDLMGWASVTSSGANNKLFFTDNGGISWNLKVDSVNDFWFTDMNTGWYIVNDKIFHTTNGGTDWSLQHSDSGNNLLSLYFYNQDLGWAAGYDGYILNTMNGGTPVELVSFSANVSGNDVVLNWMTATETNNYGFEIKRSQKSNVKSQTWEKIGFAQGKGTTTEVQTYRFTDIGLPSGKYSYRLKQIDFDGTINYSNTIEVNVGIPVEFSLEQNYPNPFNPTTKIKFTIPNVTLSEVEGSLVSLKVYDLLGREITTLVNEEKPAGTYEVEFDAEGLSSGTYFYSLQAGDFVETKKLSLLK